MSRNSRMLALSPEEIRQISETAVASVAAQQIVTRSITRSRVVDASISGKILSKSSQGTRPAIAPSLKKASTVQSGSSEGMLGRARELAASVLSQSNGRKQLQESFSHVVKNSKK